MFKKSLLTILLFSFTFSLTAQKGIDVSRFQDSINWSKVAKNTSIEFVYIKATEGASIVDNMYKYNIKKASEAGLLVGSYHIYSSRTTAYEQFNNFKKTVGKNKQDLVPVLDIEAVHCHKLYMKRVNKLLELMEKEYGVKPMIYTSENLYKTHFDVKKYKKYHYFIANYKREPSMAYTLWQYTQHGKQKGIAGFVDFSKFNKKYDVNTIKMPEKDTVEANEEKVVQETKAKSESTTTTKPAAKQNKQNGTKQTKQKSTKQTKQKSTKPAAKKNSQKQKSKPVKKSSNKTTKKK